MRNLLGMIFIFLFTPLQKFNPPSLVDVFFVVIVVLSSLLVVFIPVYIVKWLLTNYLYNKLRFATEKAIFERSIFIVGICEALVVLTYLFLKHTGL